MGITFPGESAEYRAAREKLLAKEIELRRSMEAVAEARRALPPGPVVREDYVFDGLGRERRADEDEVFGALRAGKGHAHRLQLHVPPSPEGRPARPARRARRRG